VFPSVFFCGGKLNLQLSDWKMMLVEYQDEFLLISLNGCQHLLI